jgi:hypothetical protein
VRENLGHGGAVASQPELSAWLRTAAPTRSLPSTSGSLVDLHLRQRVVVELDDPHSPPGVPLMRKKLWFDPNGLRENDA